MAPPVGAAFVPAPAGLGAAGCVPEVEDEVALPEGGALTAGAAAEGAAGAGIVLAVVAPGMADAHGQRLGLEQRDLLDHRLVDRDAHDALVLVDPVGGGEGLAVGVLHLVQGRKPDLRLLLVVAGGLMRHARGIDPDDDEDEEHDGDAEIPAGLGGDGGRGAHQFETVRHSARRGSRGGKSDALAWMRR